MNSTAKKDMIVAVLDERKAINIETINIDDFTILTDYFVICSGTSTTHIRALCREVDEKLKEAGFPCDHIEGFESARWILMDYGDIVVHIFHREEREFYNLEKLWNTAHMKKISESDSQ